MYKAVQNKISKQAILLSGYIFAFLYIALYGQAGFQNLNQVILWVMGPILAFYIIEPNIAHLNQVPNEYYLYISLLVFAFLGYVNVIDDERFFRYVQVIVANFILMLTVYFAVNNIKEWVLIWKTIWLVGMFICSISFLFDVTPVDEYYRLQGLAGNSNGTANYARMAVIAGLISFHFYRSMVWKIITVISIVFLCYIIILTASRSNFGILLFIIAGYFIFKYFSGWRMIILFLFLFLFGNLLLFSAETFLSDFFLYQRLTRNDTVSDAFEEEGRLQLYSIAWKYFLDNPLLGVGLNQFRFFSAGHITHTDILDILVQLGIFAGGIYVYIYVKVFMKIRRLIRWFQNKLDKQVYQLIMLAFISDFLFGLSNPNWFTQIEMIVLSLYIVYVTKIKTTNAVVTKGSLNA